MCLKDWKNYWQIHYRPKNEFDRMKNAVCAIRPIGLAPAVRCVVRAPHSNLEIRKRPQQLFFWLQASLTEPPQRVLFILRMPPDGRAG